MTSRDILTVDHVLTLLHQADEAISAANRFDREQVYVESTEVLFDVAIEPEAKEIARRGLADLRQRYDLHWPVH